MKPSLTAIIWTLFLVFPFAVDAEPVYPDFSKATCGLEWDADASNYKIVVRGVGLLGYGLWISNYWNPNTLSFDFFPKAEFGVEQWPGSSGPCSFLYDDIYGNRVKVNITALDSGSLRLDAELLDNSLRLCLNNSHVFVTSNGVNYIAGGAQAGPNWGGCGDLIPGNTYQGLIINDFYNNNYPGSRPDLTKPFTFNYLDDFFRPYSVLCN